MIHQQKIIELRAYLQRVIVGQHNLLDRLLLGLLTGGHVLVEGVPGLAKTTAVKTLAAGVHAGFQRIQFTPDLLPGDLTGTDVYHSQQGDFRFAAGPLFHEIILADEINRAPAKVQAALLEAMQEHQVTVGGTTRALPALFMVMATQNPLEQAGTYPLPEAQLDRFLLHVALDYPAPDDELEILQRDRRRLMRGSEAAEAAVIDVATVLAARAEVTRVHIDPMLERYIVSLIAATRAVAQWLPDLARFVEIGASPRGSLAVARAAAARAYVQGHEYVTPDDIIDVVPDCLRHRIIMKFNARLEGVTRDMLLKQLLDAVPVP